MHFWEIINLQFEKEHHRLLCILTLFTNIIHELSLKNAWLPPIFFWISITLVKIYISCKKEVNHTCMKKIQIGHQAKFRDKDNFFPAGFISGSSAFAPYFHFRCVERASFDRNLTYSSDSCFLVMACVSYARARS